MFYLAKYNTQTTFTFPMVKRGVVDFAVSADWTPAAADSSITKDQGTTADTSNTVAVLTGGGTRSAALWKLTLTATELSAAEIVVQIVDAATKAVEDQALIIYTYGNASAKIPFDLSTATQSVSVTQWNGTNVSSPATAGIPEVNVKNVNNVSAASVTTVSANQGTTQPINFTGTGASALAKSDMVDVAGAAVSTSTAQLGVNVIQAAGTAWGSGAITAASIAADAITDAKVASDVTIASVTGAVGSVTGAVGSVTGNVGGNVVGSVASVTAGVTLTSGERNSVADALLDRDMSTGTDSGSSTVRTVRQALRFLRNKWDIASGTLTVKKEDDSTTSWTASISTDATAAPVIGSDPAGP